MGIAPPSVNYDMIIGKKADIDPMEFHIGFSDIQSKYEGQEFIYTDGSKNDERVGFGVLAQHSKYKERLPNVCSVFTAELMAIKYALKYISESSATEFVICSDSLSSLQSIENMNIENPVILDIVTQHHWLCQSGKSVIFVWVPGHMEISGNEKVDKLAKKALDLEVTVSQIPYSDFKPVANEFLWSSWQSHWSEQVCNKLFKIKPCLGIDRTMYPMSRREQIVLTRARIGHAYLTQGYLLRQEDPPVCVSCAQPLSVEHILIQCVDLADVRQRFYDCKSLKTLFDSVSVYDIIGFLKAAGLFYRF